MRVSLWFAPLILLAAHAESAAGALLAEWSWEHPTPLVAPARYQLFSHFTNPFGVLIWTTETSQLNGTFAAPPDIVEAVDRLWTTGKTGTQNGMTKTVCDVNGCQGEPMSMFGIDVNWAMDVHNLPGWTGARHVPRLGLTLFGYDITGLEKVVTPTSQAIRVHGTALTTADYNGDGVVDGADYVTWRKNSRPSVGNWGYWRANFGKVSGGLPSVSVPEPATWVMMAAGTAGLLMRRRVR